MPEQPSRPTPAEASEPDELFDLPADRFTAARDALAGRLRAAGEAEAARHVKALRRPTLPAWAANQVARRTPALVTRLLEAGEALVREQRRLLSGVGADVRAAGRARRDAVAAAVEAAVELLREAGADPDAHRDRLAATFEAGSLGGVDGERLRAGRLTRELAPPSGVGLGAGLSVVADEPAAAEAPAKGATSRVDAAETRTAGAERPEDARAAASAAAREAAERARQASREAEDAADRAAAAGEEADRAVAALEAARAEARQAAAALEAARAAAAAAEAEVERARAAADAAARDQEDAEERARAAQVSADDLAEDARRAGG